MKIKAHYRIDSYLLKEIENILKAKNLSINELLTIAINCYQQREIKQREKKKDLSICIEENLIGKIKQIAIESEKKQVDVIEDILVQFLEKKILQ